MDATMTFLFWYSQRHQCRSRSRDFYQARLRSFICPDSISTRLRSEQGLMIHVIACEVESHRITDDIEVPIPVVLHVNNMCEKNVCSHFRDCSLSRPPRQRSKLSRSRRLPPGISISFSRHPLKRFFSFFILTLRRRGRSRMPLRPDESPALHSAARLF